jgi:hypothetical protein
MSIPYPRCGPIVKQFRREIADVLLCQVAGRLRHVSGINIGGDTCASRDKRRVCGFPEYWFFDDLMYPVEMILFEKKLDYHSFIPPVSWINHVSHNCGECGDDRPLVPSIMSSTPMVAL